MGRSDVTFIDFPERFDVRDYERGREHIVEEYGDKPSVLGVFDYGTVEHPGISDLDIMLIMGDDASPTWVERVGEGLPSTADKLVGHGNIILINESTFNELHYIDPGLKPQQLAGVDIKPDSVPTNLIPYRDHASVLDWLPERIFQVYRLERASKIPVMRSLQLLKSLGYTLKTVDELIDFSDGVRFAEQVKSLRSDWFDLRLEDQKIKLMECIQEAVSTGRAALGEWGGYRPRAIIQEQRKRPGVLSYFNGLAYRSGVAGIQEHCGWTVIDIPSFWFDHYRAYASHQSKLGNLIRRSTVGPINTGGSLSTGYVDYLDKKLTICSRNFEWVQNLNLKSGSFRFGFLLPRTEFSNDEFESLRNELRQIAEA